MTPHDHPTNSSREVFVRLKERGLLRDLSVKSNNLMQEGFRIVKEAASKALCPLSTQEAELGVSMFALTDSADFDPLSKSEFDVLACALFTASTENRSIDAADVLALTARYQAKAMTVGTVYPTLRKLCEKSLLEMTSGFSKKTNRETTRYKITERGKNEFKLTVLNSIPALEAVQREMA